MQGTRKRILCDTEDLSRDEGTEDMGRNFSGGLLAGVTAAVIWTAVCMIVNMGAQTTGIWALIFLVGVTVISMVISMIVGNSKADRATS